ncbi:MAG: C-GCAxxG-C-C family protein [Clostridiales bacterium]|nr:C-GCAxxG-C-C family protein [Clostridiales bacterium]
MKNYGEIAEGYFRKGYNCSQSVAAAFAEEMGMEPELVLKTSAGFGGGFGRMREVCGAFSGMVFVAGALYGNTDPAGKSAFYAEIQELARRYKEQNGRGSIVCRELLGLKKPEGTPVAEARTEEYYKKRPCPELIRIAADIMGAYVQEREAVVSFVQAGK